MNKENCGISCIRRWMEITEHYDEGVLNELKTVVNEEGLSFSSIMDVMKRNGYTARAYRSKVIFTETPYLLLDDRRKHYYLVEKFTGTMVYLYDPNIGTVRLYRFLFRLIWCQYYLTICYNDDE